MTVLDTLRSKSSPEASHQKSMATPCAQSTRRKILEEIREWMASPGGTDPVFWLNGPPGIGKSSIAKTVAENSERDLTLAASFFFTRNKEVTSPKHVFPTIAHQMLSNNIVQHTNFPKLNDSVQNQDETYLPIQANELLKCPLELPFTDTPRRLAPMIVVIDTVDGVTEEKDKHEVWLVLSLIASLGSLLSNGKYVPLRFLITSVPGNNIENCFKGIPSEHTYRQHALTPDEAQADVYVFLQDKLEGFLSDSQIQKLAVQSGGLFVYATVVARFFTSAGGRTTAQRLAALERDTSVLLKRDTPLDRLYNQVLQTSDYLDVDKPTRLLVHRILLLQEPLPSLAIERLFHLYDNECQGALETLRSVLRVEDGKPVDVFHASFRDYILSQEHDPRYTVDPPVIYADIAQFCLQLITESKGANNSIAQAGIIKGKKDALHYACCYWQVHLTAAFFNPYLAEALAEFGNEALYFWLEAYIFLKDAGDAILSLQSITEWAVSAFPFVYDSFPIFS
jgi:hypothetical protein